MQIGKALVHCIFPHKKLNSHLSISNLNHYFWSQLWSRFETLLYLTRRHIAHHYFYSIVPHLNSYIVFPIYRHPSIWVPDMWGSLHTATLTQLPHVDTHQPDAFHLQWLWSQVPSPIPLQGTSSPPHWRVTLWMFRLPNEVCGLTLPILMNRF